MMIYLKRNRKYHVKIITIIMTILRTKQKTYERRRRREIESM